MHEKPRRVLLSMTKKVKNQKGAEKGGSVMREGFAGGGAGKVRDHAD